MQNRDILWAISLPFRMYNTKEVDINRYIFTLSFDTALPNINVSKARKLISLALEKGWITRIEGENLLHANFELWEPKFFPPSWRPNFANLPSVKLIDLIPLESEIVYKPKIVEKQKKAKPMEVSPLLNSRPPQVEKPKTAKKPKKIPSKKKIENHEEPTETEKQAPPKKKQAPKKEKRKGQKSIQDFFS